MLFPPHFLKGTLVRIGGHALVFERGDEIEAVGFLFPRGERDGRREYTLRFHAVDRAQTFDTSAIADLAAEALSGACVHFYDPAGQHRFEPSHETHGDVELGRPNAAEAAAIRSMQAAIWGSAPDYLYPADIHSRDSGSAASLVARADGRLAGYLFGFVKFDGAPLPQAWQGWLRSDLRIESQQLAVLPEFRSHGIATALKAAQAEAARQASIDVVNWTADPLQWPNAVLNLGRLRAVAFEFLPNYYDFRNALNRVTPSRIGLTWLVNTPRVTTSLQAPGGAAIGDPASWNATVLGFGTDVYEVDRLGPTLAVEIPRNWTALQADDFEQALRWRASTDRLLAEILGPDPGRYMLTGVAQQGERRYLIAERVTPQFLGKIIVGD
jgi:predicted GNAT superfamily acetyltransferase